MSIQGSINQTLSIASLLLSQNPTLRAKMQQRGAMSELDKREKDVLKKIDVASASKSKDAAKLIEEYQKELSDVRKQKFETTPSQETLSAYLGEDSAEQERPTAPSVESPGTLVRKNRSYAKKSRDALIARRAELERARLLNEMLANNPRMEEPMR